VKSDLRMLTFEKRGECDVGRLAVGIVLWGDGDGASGDGI